MDISTAMIIEDSEGDQLLAKMQIKEFDEQINVLQAYDGQEALEILDTLEKQPDVIFLDINMPRMNGLEFLEHYNKRENHSNVIAMLTSSNQSKDKDKALSYEFVKHYFVKLLDTEDLNIIQSL